MGWKGERHAERRNGEREREGGGGGEGWGGVRREGRYRRRDASMVLQLSTAAEMP